MVRISLCWNWKTNWQTNWLKWLMPCHSQEQQPLRRHKPLVSTQLCLVLLPPFPAIHVSYLSRYSLVTLFLCSLAVSSVELAWQCCLHFFWNVCPRQFQFLPLYCRSTSSLPVFFNSSLSTIPSGQCTFMNAKTMKSTAQSAMIHGH